MQKHHVLFIPCCCQLLLFILFFATCNGQSLDLLSKGDNLILKTSTSYHTTMNDVICNKIPKLFSLPKGIEITYKGFWFSKCEKRWYLVKPKSNLFPSSLFIELANNTCDDISCSTITLYESRNFCKNNTVLIYETVFVDKVIERNNTCPICNNNNTTSNPGNSDDTWPFTNDEFTQKLFIVMTVLLVFTSLTAAISLIVVFVLCNRGKGKTSQRPSQEMFFELQDEDSHVDEEEITMEKFEETIIDEKINKIEKVENVKEGNNELIIN